MVDIEPSFRVVEDGTTGAGEALQAREEGESHAGNVLPAYVFKDSSGQAVLPSLDASGNLKVAEQGAGATVVSGGTTLLEASVTPNADNDVLTLTLVASTTYMNIDFDVASSSTTKWEVVQNDNASETVLATFLTGSGQQSYAIKQGKREFTTGATGAQELIIRAVPKKDNDLHASGSVTAQ